MVGDSQDSGGRPALVREAKKSAVATLWRNKDFAERLLPWAADVAADARRPSAEVRQFLSYKSGLEDALGRADDATRTKIGMLAVPGLSSNEIAKVVELSSDALIMFERFRDAAALRLKNGNIIGAAGILREQRLSDPAAGREALDLYRRVLTDETRPEPERRAAC